jgi:hypothetical protein
VKKAASLGLAARPNEQAVNSSLMHVLPEKHVHDGLKIAAITDEAPRLSAA